MPDNRIQTVRFWLLVLAATALSRLCPELFLACVPMLAMPPLFGTTCNGCSSGFKDQYQIVIDGISNAADCSDCAQYNGTWTVTISTDYAALTGTSPPTICFANYQINPCFCVGASAANQAAEQKWSTNQIFMRVTTTTVSVVFASNGTGINCHAFAVLFGSWAERIIWRNTFGAGTLDCGALSSYAVVFEGETSTGCDSDSTDAIVTAL